MFRYPTLIQCCGTIPGNDLLRFFTLENFWFRFNIRNRSGPYLAVNNIHKKYCLFYVISCSIVPRKLASHIGFFFWFFWHCILFSVRPGSKFGFATGIVPVSVILIHSRCFNLHIISKLNPAHRYQQSVRVQSQQPYQLRTYTWCWAFPPKCSRYKIVMRIVFKTEVSLMLTPRPTGWSPDTRSSWGWGSSKLRSV